MSELTTVPAVISAERTKLDKYLHQVYTSTVTYLASAKTQLAKAVTEAATAYAETGEEAHRMQYLAWKARHDVFNDIAEAINSDPLLSAEVRGKIKDGFPALFPTAVAAASPPPLPAKTA